MLWSSATSGAGVEQPLEGRERHVAVLAVLRDVDQVGGVGDAVERRRAVASCLA